MEKKKLDIDMPVVILCGGEGTRFYEQSRDQPKPLVRIGPFPLLWHVMKTYSTYGFKSFILCLGYKGHMIKDYFLNYEVRKRDFIFRMRDGAQQFLGEAADLDWDITFAETGLKTMTGGRIKKIEKYIRTDNFMVTYADGLANIDLNALVGFHLSQGKIGTVTGVKTMSQFGEMVLDGNLVTAFAEKPKISSMINGGFFVFKREFFKFLDDSEKCVLEREPMERLVARRELCVYRHDGFWQCLDTFKDYQIMNELWDQNDEPPWEKR